MPLSTPSSSGQDNVGSPGSKSPDAPLAVAGGVRMARYDKLEDGLRKNWAWVSTLSSTEPSKPAVFGPRPLCTTRMLTLKGRDPPHPGRWPPWRPVKRARLRPRRAGTVYRHLCSGHAATAGTGGVQLSCEPMGTGTNVVCVLE